MREEGEKKGGVYHLYRPIKIPGSEPLTLNVLSLKGPLTETLVVDVPSLPSS